MPAHPGDALYQTFDRLWSRLCAVDLPPFVPMALTPESGPQIVEYVNLEWVPTTFGMTPIVDQLRYYLEDHSDSMPEFYANDDTAYLVVIFDGDDTCEDGSDEPDVAAIVAALTDTTSRLFSERGIRTIALGFGDTGSDMARELNAIAAAGGSEFTTFFPISSDGGLAAAFSEISTSIISCEFDIVDLDETADPETVNFYFDGEGIGHDESGACTRGWVWVEEFTRVEFCGAQCEQIKSGEVELINATFGCEQILW